MKLQLSRIAIVAPLIAALGLVALPAQAYVGPGAGLSLLSALWALVAAIGAALLFIVAWPIRKMIKRKAAAQVEGSDSQGPGAQ